MSTLLNKRYLVKVSTNGGGGQNTANSVYVVCTQPLCSPQRHKEYIFLIVFFKIRILVPIGK